MISGSRCVARDRAVDQQRLGRAADAGAPHLGVEHDRLRHVELGRLVHVDVANAFEMREHRHARLRLHARDQALAAARHDDVDGAVEPGEHHPDRGAVARRHQLDRGFGQRGRAQALGQRGVDRAIAAMALRAAAQDRGIAGLEAERGGIGGDVRAALVDDADDAERHPHALDGHAVRPRPALRHRADRIGERAHHVERLGHGGDALVVERQPVEERRRRAGCLGLGQVLGIGGEDIGLVRADRRRHRRERGVLLRRRRQREHARGRLGAAADVVHQGGDVGRALDGLERGGHGEIHVLSITPSMFAARGARSRRERRLVRCRPVASGGALCLCLRLQHRGERLARIRELGGIDRHACARSAAAPWRCRAAR